MVMVGVPRVTLSKVVAMSHPAPWKTNSSTTTTSAPAPAAVTHLLLASCLHSHNEAHHGLLEKPVLPL